MCNAPLCHECGEEVKPGVFCCFQCAMLQSVSEIGSGLKEKKAKAIEKKKKKKWAFGPFQYFLVVSSVLIVVMWGVILFGGQAAPGKAAEFAKEGRVLLFMVDGALKRYAHYENNTYPSTLSDLVPKYVDLKEPDLVYLNRLKYTRDSRVGYRLSLAAPEKGEMNPVLTAGGIEYVPSVKEGA